MNLSMQDQRTKPTEPKQGTSLKDTSYADDTPLLLVALRWPRCH